MPRTLWANERACILDFTDDFFKIYHFEPDSYSLLWRKQFDIVLNQNNISENIIEWIDAGSKIELKSFNDILSIIAHEKDIIRIIFDAYFSENYSLIQKYLKEPHLILIVPMNWETEVNKVLSETIEQVFKRKTDICTQAIPLFCHAVDIEKKDNKTIMIKKMLKDAFSTHCYYKYRIERTKDEITVNFLGWKYSNDNAIKNSYDCVYITESDTNESPEVSGLFKLMKYLQQDNAPRMSFKLNPVLGINHDQTFRVMIHPNDALQSKTSHYYQTINDESLVDIPVAAQLDNEMEADFCLPRIQIRHNKVINRNSSICVSMCKVSRRKILIKLQLNDNKSLIDKNMEYSFMMKYPSLFY